MTNVFVHTLLEQRPITGLLCYVSMLDTDLG
jgi:hypothetical protein